MSRYNDKGRSSTKILTYIEIETFTSNSERKIVLTEIISFLSFVLSKVVPLLGSRQSMSNYYLDKLNENLCSGKIIV